LGREVWWDFSPPLSEVSRCSRVAAPMKTGSGSSSDYYVKAVRMETAGAAEHLFKGRGRMEASPFGVEVKRVVLGVASWMTTGSGSSSLSI